MSTTHSTTRFPPDPPTPRQLLLGARSSIVKKWSDGNYAPAWAFGYETTGGKYPRVAGVVHCALNELWALWQKDRKELVERIDFWRGLSNEHCAAAAWKTKEVKVLSSSLDFAYKRVDPSDTWHLSASKIAGFKRIIDAKKAKKALEKKRGLEKALEDIEGNPYLSEEIKLRLKRELTTKRRRPRK